MAIAVSVSDVERILLGAGSQRRQLQDSPVLADVWARLAQSPGAAIDLLITPHKSKPASVVANKLFQEVRRDNDDDPRIAYLQGIVAARLTLQEVLHVIVPLTDWWQDPRNQSELRAYLDKQTGAARLKRTLGVLYLILGGPGDIDASSQHAPDIRLSAIDRFLALAGLLVWAETAAPKTTDNGNKERDTKPIDFEDKVVEQAIKAILKRLPRSPKKTAQPSSDTDEGKFVYRVSLNRSAAPAIARSVSVVKADAARTLFSIDCSKIGWAVIDVGIDGAHKAFLDPQTGLSRIRDSFDFTNLRLIVSLSNGNPAIRARNLKKLSDLRPGSPLPKNADALLGQLAADLSNEGPINWALVRPFVQIRPEEPVISEHGTHVAGIIGASKLAADKAAVGAKLDPHPDCVDGMCPDIQLYDFRVIGADDAEVEFSVIGALQFIRYLNQSHSFVTIHGANLSLSIPHDVHNHACGATPVCNECERLIDSGVVVVAAAGNYGYNSLQTTRGVYNAYTAFSITDPGNADGVITVGSTHRLEPHTYGVSFFSSRGPTGDGRLKPDLVAPGERIRAPIPGDDWGDLDGTSMAAPHVSGAAAMLMARHTELIGRPRRVKKILCDSATDLERERSFQGRGLLDVLRALQSV